MRRPIIAVTCDTWFHQPESYEGPRPSFDKQKRAYAAKLIAAGGVPLLVPSSPDTDYMNDIQELVDGLDDHDPNVLRAVQEEIKYEGYIRREQRQIDRLSELESVRLPSGLDLSGTPGLSLEVIEKLEAVRPLTLGQASRIPGITPAALAVLRVHLRSVSRET